MPSSRSIVALGFLVVALAAVPCSFAGAAANASAAAKPAAYTVTIEGTAFGPAALTVKVGDTITWANKDPYPHTATSKSAGFDSREIAPGKTWKFTARKKGSFPYICTIHPSMKGLLRVN